jgi:hypothetical protein
MLKIAKDLLADQPRDSMEGQRMIQDDQQDDHEDQV